VSEQEGFAASDPTHIYNALGMARASAEVPELLARLLEEAQAAISFDNQGAYSALSAWLPPILIHIADWHHSAGEHGTQQKIRAILNLLAWYKEINTVRRTLISEVLGAEAPGTQVVDERLERLREQGEQLIQLAQALHPAQLSSEVREARISSLFRSFLALLFGLDSMTTKLFEEGDFSRTLQWLEEAEKIRAQLHALASVWEQILPHE
jgi:hypothetical protein